MTTRRWPYYLFLCATVFSFTNTVAQKVILSGYVYEKESGERLPAVSVRVAGGTSGTTTNNYGFYSLQVAPGDSVIISYSAVGYQSIEKVIAGLKDQQVLTYLAPMSTLLDEVVITEKQVTSTNSLRLPVRNLKDIPSLLGEHDIVKALQLLPGVNRGTEGFAAYYVRGGGMDQNLILLDEAPVYNANHVFGLFSSFNADAIRSVSFWKDDFSARYGGRLSSVLDLQMKEGNKQQFRAEGGIGLTSSRLTIEGPIVKDKASFMVSGRRSYIDLIMMPLMPENQKQRYRFYDLNAKINYKLDEKNQLYVSGYFSNDLLSEKNIVKRTSSRRDMRNQLDWGNATASLRWNHQLGKKGFVNTTLYHTRYNFSVLSDGMRTTDSTQNRESLRFNSSLMAISIKTDFNYYLSSRHTFNAGGQWTRQGFTPRHFQAFNTASSEAVSATDFVRNQEVVFYAEDRFVPDKHWEISLGLRLNTLLTSEKNYNYPEPRASVSYRLPKGMILTAAYSRTNQFVHLLSNTGLGLSTDLYVPVTTYTPPQRADQISGTLKKYFNKPHLELSISTYRKWMGNIIAYKDGADFLAIGDDPKDIPWQNNVTTGKGKSYGTEMLLRRDAGRLTGWIGYTLSWTVHQFPALNDGKPFIPRYDRRHNLSLTGTYSMSNKIRLSTNWVYYTGNYINAPYAFSSGKAYSGYRNSFKTPNYHRLDLGVQFHKKKKWGSRYWEVGLYNAYLKRNLTYFYMTNSSNAEGQKVDLKGRAIFSIIPSISYNFSIGL
jgi:hypothetical protein